MSLVRARVAQPCRITRVRDTGPISCRLMEMGLVEGAHVQVVGRAPLGGPLHLRVGDFELSLRCHEAELVEVTEV